MCCATTAAADADTAAAAALALWVRQFSHQTWWQSVVVVSIFGFEYRDVYLDEESYTFPKFFPFIPTVED